MPNPTPPPASSPVGGDPSKPGAWTQAQIDDWNRVKACDHSVFWAANPRPHEDTCVCGAIVRTVTTEPDYATLAEDRLHVDEESATRAAEAAYERRLGL